MKSSRRRTALLVSIIFHAILACVLVFWYLPSRSGTKTAQQVSGNSSGSSSKKPQKPAPPKPMEAVDPEQIQKSLDSQIKAVDSLSEEKKRSELEKNLRRLDSIANTDSVVKTSKTVANAIGLDSDTYNQPKPSAAGPIDVSTSQLEDIQRTKSDTGQWQYEAIMVDAKGRTARVPMSQTDGESVYQTFQTMKRYPMAKGIYRNVVMPLLQKMMDAEDAAVEAERAARRLEVEKADRAAAKKAASEYTMRATNQKKSNSGNLPD